MEQSILISASYDKQIRFWNTVTGDTVYYFTFQDSQINTLLYIPDTQFLAVAGYGVIRLYSFASPSPTSITGNLQRSTTHFSDVANNVNMRMINVNDALPAGMGNTGFGVANVNNGIVAGKVGGVGVGAMRGVGGGGGSGSGAAGVSTFPSSNQAPLLYASYERANSLNFTSLGYFTLESESNESYNHGSDEIMEKYMSTNVTKIGSNEQLIPAWHIPVDELGATVVLPEQHRRNCKLILFATSEDGHIVFFDAQSQTTLRPIKDIATGVAITCSSLSPNQRYLLTGNQIGLVSVWHLPSIIASVQTNYNDTHKTESGLTKLEQDNRTKEHFDTDDTTKREKDVITCTDLNKSNNNYINAKELKEEIKIYGSKPIQVISFDNNYSAIRSIAIEPLARWAVVATNVGRLHFLRFARDVNLSGSKSDHDKNYKSTSIHTRNQGEHVLDSVKSIEIGETVPTTTSHRKAAPTDAINSSTAKKIIDDKATAVENDKEEADVFNSSEAKGQMQRREGNEKESQHEIETEVDNNKKIVLQNTAGESESDNKMHESDVKNVMTAMNNYNLDRKITVDSQNNANDTNETDDNTCALRNIPKQSVYQSALAVNEINEQVMHSAELLDDENDDSEFENTEGHVSNTSMGTALLETLTQLQNNTEESHQNEHSTNDCLETRKINENTLCDKEEAIRSEKKRHNDTRREAESTDEVCENDLIAENKETCFAAKNAKSTENLEQINESKQLSLREQMEMEVFHSFNAHYKYILKVGINQTGDLLVTCSADYSVGRFVVPECLRVFVQNNTLQEHPTSEDKKALQEKATEMESENRSQANTQRSEKHEKLKETSNVVSSTTPMHSNSTVAHVLKPTNKEESHVGHTLLRPERSERENSNSHSGEIRVDNDNISNVNDTTLTIAITNLTEKTGVGVNCSIDHSRNTEDELSSYASSNVTSSLTDGGHGSNAQIRHSTKHHFNNLYFKPLKPLAGHNRWVWDCAFGDCGRYLFTASSDNTIRKWSNLLSDSVEYTTFTGHSKPVIALTMYKNDQQQLYKAK